MFQKTIRLYKDAYSGLSREIWLLAIISLINRAGAMVFPFLTIYLTTALGFSLKETGIIMGFFGLGSITGAYIGGWLTDRIGSFKVQFWSLVLSSVVLLWMVQFQSFWSLCFFAFLFSLIADAFRPATKVAVANYSEPENLTRSFALLRLAVNLGFSIGPAMAGLIAAWKGYDWLFYIDAISCFSAAILLRVTLKDDFKGMAIKEESSNTSNSVEHFTAPSVRPFTSPYQDRFFMFFLVIVSLLSFAFLQLFYIMPVYLKQGFGFNEGEIGLLIALNGTIIVLVEMPIVYLIEKRYRKFSSMTIGALLIGLGFAIFIVPSVWIGIAIMSIVLLTFGEIIYMPFASAFVAERSTESNRGQYMALYTMAWASASIVAPISGLYISEHYGFNTLWIILLIVGLGGGLGFWYLGTNINKSMSKVVSKVS